MAEGFKPFEEALRGFKAAAPNKQPEVTPEEKKATDNHIPAAEPVLAQAENVDPQTGLTLQDQLLFESIVAILGINQQRDENRYWRVRDVIRDSHQHDVAFNMRRWITGRPDTPPRLTQMITPVLKRGYESQTRIYLRSLTPENMKYGTNSREQRIEEAQKYAALAGIDIKLLAKEEGVEI